MSRYTIPALDPQYTVVVGWDPPLETFFAQVFDRAIEEDEDAEVCWVGMEPESLTTVEALAIALEAWATIPEVMVETLRRDQATTRTPSLLQRRMRHFFAEERG